MDPKKIDKVSCVNDDEKPGSSHVEGFDAATHEACMQATPQFFIVGHVDARDFFCRMHPRIVRFP